MFEIKNPAGKANSSAYGGQVLNFDSTGVARVEALDPRMNRWLRLAGYSVTEIDAEAVSFDPSEHTVSEVMEYLADANDAERERVLAVEAEGKARKSILGDDTTDTDDAEAGDE